MMTKSDLVMGAYDEMRISGLTVKPSSEDIVLAIKRLDNMMADWQNKGLCLEYNKTANYGKVDPNQSSGLADSSALAAILNLAVSLSPAFGLEVSRETKSGAKSSYEGLFSIDLGDMESNPYLPRGQGENYYGFRWYNQYMPYEEGAPVECSTNKMVAGESGPFESDFRRYINEVPNDFIVSFTIEDGESVEVISSSEAEGIVYFNAKANAAGYSKVLITITTELGRVLPRNVSFDVANL